jgi:hypothetical protein
MSSIEQRRHERTEVSWQVRAGRRGLGVAQGTLNNVSISGAYLEIPLSLSVDDRLLLEIRPNPADEAERILAECAIKRKESLPESGQFGYGVQFVRLSVEDMQKLLALVAEHWASQGDNRSAQT